MVSLSNHEREFVRPSTSSGRTNILVVAAVPQELQDFRSAGLQGVHRLVTGMGRAAGQAVLQRLSAGDVGLVVSAGFAGGARPGFKTGDLVLASEVIQASFGERSRPDPSFFSLSDKASVGPFVTVDKPLADPEAKAWAGNRFGAIAVEMETAWVARSAEAAGVAWVGIRAILDPMEYLLRVHSPAQALRCAASPGRWGEFSDFLGRIRTAGRSLADGLHDLMERRKRWI